MYGADYAEIYDLIYASRDKDYAGESAELAALVRARKPDADSLLDVACGTGGHLAYLKQDFGTLAGLEQSEHMIVRANRAMPEIPVHQGDMRDFHLDQTFDAVVCMFSSIGYVGSTAALDRTLKSCAQHLNPGGVVIIEPWYFPDQFLPGYIADDLVRSPERVTVRVSHSTREGDQVSMTVHYIDAQKDSGIRHHTDVHAMSLFQREQYEAAFEQAGCKVEYLPGGGRFNCGLFIGTRAD
ncbi:methyltransferase domain-containing protein [Crossiella sp. SN42]|uniref:methyltransferase domain-containing protein n=1 Tax=Crossiella sp. SN42 TaxID=2944808 RepID=UPI00207C4C97|nr:methyltransferase domain-containing protein [Crossiella sp. SN42]MCO1576041.1 methyltransferase domain-containing protein [Crossiella sp. SN42]